MKRFGLLMALTALLCAPAWGRQFKKQDTLEPDEGILVTSTLCGHPIAGVQLFQSGKSSGGFWGPLKSDGSIGCGPGPWLIRLKAGSYYVGQFYSGTSNLAIPEDKSPRFNVEAGKLNYVGDLYVGDVSMDKVDEQTLIRIAGRTLTVINHETQMRQLLEREHAETLARYPFVVDAGLSPPVPVAPAPAILPGQMQGLMTISSPRWKRGEDGQPRICQHPIPLPKGTRLAPGEDLQCNGDFVTAETLIAAEIGQEAKVVTVTPRTDDDGSLVITFTAPAPEAKDKKK